MDGRVEWIPAYLVAVGDELEVPNQGLARVLRVAVKRDRIRLLISGASSREELSLTRLTRVRRLLKAEQHDA